MATPQIQLDIDDKHQIVRTHGVNGARRTVLAALSGPVTDAANKSLEYNTIIWESEDARDSYHKSVFAFLDNQKIRIGTILMKGQKPDVIDRKAPPCPPMHKLQGDLTPDVLEWELKYAPVRLQNKLGIECRPIGKDEPVPADPRELWVRADVIRTISGPKPETFGGEYESIRFKARNQIIARRMTHLSFTKREILVEVRDASGNLVENTTPEQYIDPYSQDSLARLEKRQDIEIVWRRASAASAGSQF